MKELQKQLKAMNLKRSDKVLIHSALRAINRDADLVLDTLIDYFKDGMLLLPTHTWAQMNEDYKVFDNKTEPSCVGLLTNMFRLREGVKRSYHPTHSMAGIGEGIDDFLARDLKVNTPCHPDGTWGNLGNVGAKILLIGTDMTRNTFVHAIEEIVDIPDRLAINPILFEIVMPDGSILKKEYYKHYHPRFKGLSNNYKIAEAALIDLGIITIHKFGDADVMLMDAMELQKQILKWLEINPRLFDSQLPMDKELAKIKYWVI